MEPDSPLAANPVPLSEMPPPLPTYDRHQTYDWNFAHAPEPVSVDVPHDPGTWDFCGLPVPSPLGISAGPLLNGKWLLYYAALGFDVLTYKTVRSADRACYALPNLQPVQCGQLRGDERALPAIDEMHGSWAVSFGMPSKRPSVWRADLEQTKNQLPAGKVLSVSVVGSIQDGWSLDDLGHDYARCAAWAIESGADCIEANFSCPNVATCDGQLYQHPADAGVVAQHLRQRMGDRPLILKVGQMQAREQAVELLGSVAPYADAIALTNSIAATVVDARRELIFDGERRGICGAATRTASVAQTAMFCSIIKQQRLDLKLIGVGGVSEPAHVRDYLQAGAHAVHIATAAMVDPLVGIKLRDRGAV